jgi:transposase
MSIGAVDLWALDEVHFQQYGSRCRTWVPSDVSDPVLPHHPTRRSVGYFGAVRLRDGKFIFRREAGSFNGQTFLEFLRCLKEIARRGDRPAVVIADNAKYHHAVLHKEWRERSAEILRLDFLPPYSPELNPIERVWKLTRRLCLHNRYFETLESVIEAVEKQFIQWSSPNDTLRRLCAIT